MSSKISGIRVSAVIDNLLSRQALTPPCSGGLLSRKQASQPASRLALETRLYHGCAGVYHLHRPNDAPSGRHNDPRQQTSPRSRTLRGKNEKLSPNGRGRRPDLPQLDVYGDTFSASPSGPEALDPGNPLT